MDEPLQWSAINYATALPTRLDLANIVSLPTHYSTYSNIYDIRPAIKKHYLSGFITATNKLYLM